MIAVRSWCKRYSSAVFHTAKTERRAPVRIMDAKILPGMERRMERTHENPIFQSRYQLTVSPMQKAAAIFFINAEEIEVCDFSIHIRPCKA